MRYDPTSTDIEDVRSFIENAIKGGPLVEADAFKALTALTRLNRILTVYRHSVGPSIRDIINRRKEKIRAPEGQNPTKFGQF